MALPVYTLPTYDIFGKTGKEAEPTFREQTRFQRLETVMSEEQRLREMRQPLKKGAIDAAKGVWSVMEFVGGVLNLPGAAISGAVTQLVDKKPGFDAQEYLKSVFNFKDQASWRHVIELTAESSENKNVWDKRWAQVVGGLVLDILLDPTTYVGYGLVKGAISPAKATKLARATASGMVETYAKTGLKNADKVIEGTFTRILKQALQPSAVGWQIPFSKYAKPFRGVSEIGQQVKNLPIEEGVKALTPFAQKAIQKPSFGIRTFAKMQQRAPRLAKGVEWFEKAFVPYGAGKDIQRNKIRVQNVVSENVEQLKAAMHRMVKEIPDEEARRIAHGYMQDIGEIAYKEGELVDVLAKKANLITNMMKNFQEGKGTPQRVGRLLKQLEADESKAFVGDTSKLLRGWLDKARKFKAGKLKKMPKALTPEELFRSASKIYDETRIRRMVRTLEDTGLKADDLLTAEHFVPHRKTLAEALESVYPNMSREQKNVVNAIADETREILDAWYVAEKATGRDIKYMKNYMVGGRAVVKGKVADIPAFKQFFEFQKKFPTTREAYNYYVPMLINKGYAKNWDDGVRIMREGHEKFGQIIDTIDEAMMIRGAAHHKFMARHEFMEGAKKFGVQIKGDVGAGFRRVGAGELKGWVFPDKIAESIDNVMEVLDDGKAIGQFIKAHDKIMGWYKVMWTVVNPGFHLRNCLSEDTEVLTSEGWKEYTDLKVGDYILAYDNGKSRWEKISRINVYDYDGEMYHFKGKSKDVLCTPEHRCVTTEGVVLAKDIKNQKSELPLTAEYEYPEGIKNIEDRIFYLIGMIVGDGSIWIPRPSKKNGWAGTKNAKRGAYNGRKNSHRRYTIYQSEKKYAEKIRLKLDKDFSETTQKWVGITNVFKIKGETARILIDILPTKESLIDLLPQCNKHQLELIYEGLIDAEGYISKDSRFCQSYEKNPVISDMFQELLILLGKNGNVNKGYVSIKTKNKTQYTIVNADKHRVKYQGKVWCPTVPSGCFWARRNGKAFPTGNSYSNHFLGYMKDGVRYMNPQTHMDSAKVVRQYFKNIDAQLYRMLGKDIAEVTPEWMGKLIPNTRLTYREFFGEITGTGTIRRQWLKPELQEYEELMKAGNYTKNVLKKINPAGKHSVFVKLGESLGSFNEAQARVASVMTGLKKINGGVEDVRRIANEVNDVFVNYRNLTSFERNVMRRAVPFYSWMKQNTANQVKFIFTMPGKYAAIPRIAQAIQPRRTPEELKPSYYKKLWMWELPITLPDGSPLFLNPNLPFQDLEKLNVRDLPRTLLTATTPFIKWPIEMAPKKGYDIFRDADLERYPGYKAPVPGVLQTFARFLEKKKPGSLGRFGIKNERGIYTMNPKAAHAITQMIPPLNNISRMTMQQPTQDNVNKMFSWLSYTFGIKIKPLDLIEMRHYRAQKEMKAIRKYWRENANI